MAVTDPLIKELKGYTAKFLISYENNEIIDDTNPHLPSFCSCLERIFNLGIVSVPNSFGFIRHNDTWTWIEKISNSKSDTISYNFTNAVDNARDCKNIFTNSGKFRLVLRYCLTRKCLHIPVEYFLNSGKVHDYYSLNSIMGDEILSEILLSVLYQCSKITFKLDVSNTSFLDLSWLLPEVVRVELVPTYNLGMSVSFSGEKAVIIKMRSNSVISECSKIAVGDILDSLNGICICSSTKGRLSTLLKCQKGRPINLTVIKAIYSHNLQYYPPILKLYKDIDLDPDEVKSKVAKTREDFNKTEEKCVLKKKMGSGFRSIYVGNVDIGRMGDMKLIDKAFNILFSTNPKAHIGRCRKIKREVQFEVGEMGVRCFDKKTGELVLKHSFMEISSCGSVLLMPNYFAYIAADNKESPSKIRSFICYIFMASDDETAYTVLQGIGQGFQRTHYAV